MSYNSDDVANYYDANTASFLRYGGGRSTQAIHRPVWAPGVSRRRAALDYVHGLLLEELAALGGPDACRVLDLGCGSGASLRWLAAHGASAGTGVSNSSLQIELARKNTRFADRLEYRLADFCQNDPQLVDQPVDLAYGIESFVQGSDPHGFFRNAAKSLRPGGRLALCDDFLASDLKADELSEQERAWLDDFRHGWRVSSLMAPQQADWLAKRHGLELASDTDLTQWLRLNRLRDLGTTAAVRMVRPFERESGSENPRWLSLMGGHALRRCLQKGLVRYRFRVWSKVK